MSSHYLALLAICLHCGWGTLPSVSAALSYSVTSPAGFYTPVGVFTVAGLHVLPAYLYFLQHIPEGWAELATSPALLYAPVAVLGLGRALAMAVEVSAGSSRLLQPA